jgi:carboxymethylenebutenolidase
MPVRKLLTRILITAGVLLAVFVLAIFGIIAFDSLFPAQRASDFTNVTFSGPDGITLQGYYTQPAGEGPFPAILMVHEFFGLNEDIIKKADLLAEQGYAVLAADAYRGNTTRLIPRAIWLVISTPGERVSADLQSAFRYLAELPQVDGRRIGTVGFCFGGTQVMRLATQLPDVAATVIFYGSGPITDPAALGAMDQGGPVLGIYGENDQSIPVDEVRGFEMAMQARGVESQVTIYPGVGHAFVDSETLAQPGPAQEAWIEMLNFLNQRLKPSL